MTSNLLSRFLPTNPANSIYADLRGHDQRFDDTDIEERAGMAIDEENLGADFHEHELDNPDLFNDDESRINSSTAFLPSETPTRQTRRQKNVSKGTHYTRSPRMLDDDEGGANEVPMSLLIESESKHPRSNKSNQAHRSSVPIPGPSNRKAQAHWESAQAQQPLHPQDDTRPPHAPTGFQSISAADRAMWTWVELEDLDSFIRGVYSYYYDNGIWHIVLTRFLGIVTLIFVATFMGFLSKCISYGKIRNHDRLKDIIVSKCTQRISGWPNVFIWLFFTLVLYRIYQAVADIPRLRRMHDFFLYCLEIPDSDIQTISWPTVVQRLMALRDLNARTTTQKLSPTQRKWLSSQSKDRMGPEDIANRLMRRDNYTVAMFNKKLLNFTLPVPFLRGVQFYSSTLQWSLDLCILDLFFDDKNQILPLILTSNHRRELSEALKRRFVFAGLMNLLLSPFILAGMVTVYFFKYFNEYQKNPSAIGARAYTPLAKWQFREFNEVIHLFEERINMSDPFAARYIQQFPKKKTTEVARLVQFVAGTIIAVLTIATLLDPDLFLGFQITENRTVLFYLGVFTAIWSICKGMIPEENQVFDPEYSLRAVIDYTHHYPSHWTDRLHTDDVKNEFSALYQPKIVIFLTEMLGVISAGFVLMFNMPDASDRIVDFFREFTVHIDGLGYVCSYAEFNFKKGPGKPDKRAKDNSADGETLRDEYYSTQHGKMAASYYNFLDNYHINPETGIPGHVPPSSRRQSSFRQPPAFPGLTASLAGDIQSSRYNARTSRGIATGSHTPRFPPVTGPSLMTSMMLDPQHLSGRDAKRTSRSQYKSTRNIRQETIEDEEEDEAPDSAMRDTKAFGASGGLDESQWETSPTRHAASAEAAVPDGDAIKDRGVLGLLYQFQNAHNGGGMGGPGGVNF